MKELYCVTEVTSAPAETPKSSPSRWCLYKPHGAHSCPTTFHSRDTYFREAGRRGRYPGNGDTT